VTSPGDSRGVAPIGEGQGRTTLPVIKLRRTVPHRSLFKLPKKGLSDGVTLGPALSGGHPHAYLDDGIRVRGGRKQATAAPAAIRAAAPAWARRGASAMMTSDTCNSPPVGDDYSSSS